MSELRDYQKKMLESKSKVVFCNWDRGEGKTRSICEKILRSEGKCLCISDSNNYNKYLENIFEEKTRVKIIKSNCREMELWFGDESIYITFVKINDLGNCIGARFDNVFFDNVRRLNCGQRHRRSIGGKKFEPNQINRLVRECV